ncbi:acyl carrier protein [Campylobacter lari]|nr:acyl carrier protein [Campylobacter lari]MBT0831075.1 acyl carrier protein [Campylobacter lari]
MEDIKKFFKNIGKNEVDENADNLVEDGIIDSIDIINLVQEIETYYGTCIDFDYINTENLKNFNTIKNMIEEIISN